jgi:cytidine deaminase
MTLNLTAEHKMLLALATKAQKNAHAPYSNFHVGAAILDENAQLHASCNVENAAYPLGQCAEAGAISAMVASGSKQIKQILIASPNDDFCPPCGGCRQKIAEFANGQTEVHLATNKGEIKTVMFTELLPLAFGFDKEQAQS